MRSARDADDVDYDEIDPGSGGASSPSSGGASSRNASSHKNGPFSGKVRDALKKAFVQARMSGGTDNFKKEAEKILRTVEKEYGKPQDVKVQKKITNMIGGALFDAQEHAGEFAAKSERAINAEAEAVATSIAQDIERACVWPAQASVVRSSGGPGRDFCFLDGTMILMADGNEKKIEDVVAGDLVESCNAHTKMRTTLAVIKAIRRKVSEYYALNDTLLQVTGRHPLYVRKPDGTEGWAVLDPRSRSKHMTLAIGDMLYTRKGVRVTVTKIKHVKRKVFVNNLEIDNPDHTFFANGVLVHNGGEFK